jgi:hypothetical protein
MEKPFERVEVRRSIAGWFAGDEKLLIDQIADEYPRYS